MKKNILLSATIAAAMTVSFQASAWKTSVYLAAEHESDHEYSTYAYAWSSKNFAWKSGKGDNTTTGIVGGFLEEGNFRFDASFSQSYFSTRSAAKKNQNNIGITYFNTYNSLFGGGTGDYSIRLGYRDYAYSRQSSSGSYGNLGNAALDKVVVTNDEQRNEFWIVPTANYKFNRNFRIQGSYTYRYIDRQLTYLQRLGPLATTKIELVPQSTTSDIQSGYAGIRYTFDKGVSDFSRNYIELNYYFNKENLVNTLENDEKFLWVRGYVPYKVKGYIGGVSPYVYWAYEDAERKYYDSTGSLLNTRKASRDRYGVRISQNLPNNWSIALDGYYSPRTTEHVWSLNKTEVGQIEDTNFTYAYLELLKKF